MRSSFEYLRPPTREEACRLKEKHGNSAVCLAGGSDLLLQWRKGRSAFKFCLDLTFISDLRYYECAADQLRIGALATLADLENAEARNSYMSCIAAAAKLMCTPQLRTLATVGGNLCNASPAADLSVLFIAMGAEVTLASSSAERTISLESFFTGVNRTTLAKGEILAGVQIPLSNRKAGVSFSRVGRTVVDIAQVNAATCIIIDPDGTVDQARIALGAVAPTPIRCKEGERILQGKKVEAVDAQTIEQAAAAAQKVAKPISDIRASAEYRYHVTKVLVKRSLERSIQDIGGA